MGTRSPQEPRQRDVDVAELRLVPNHGKVDVQVEQRLCGAKTKPRGEEPRLVSPPSVLDIHVHLGAEGRRPL
eukprot:1981575-Pyramimonas_sp.AAC.2